MKSKAIVSLSLLAFLAGAGVVFADEATGQRYRIYYDNGVTLYKEKKYNLAIEEFKKVLWYAPFDKNVQNSICQSYQKQADVLRLANKPKEAMAALRSALFYMKFWSDEAGADKNEIASLETLLNQLSKKYENFLTADVRYQNAVKLRQEGEVAAAGYEFNKLKNNPKYGLDSSLALFDIYKYRNNQQMALDNIRYALKLKPESALAHFKYAVLLDDINNSEAANDEYTLAFKYSDKEPAVLNSLKGLWLKRAQDNPRNVEAHTNLGAIYQKTKQFDLSKAEYEKALEINPNDSIALSNLASLYIDTGNFEGAIGIYDRIIAKNKNDLAPYFYKAEAYKKMGNNRGAIGEYRKILGIAPDNDEAKDAIANVVAGLTGDKLVNYLREDADLDPYNAEKQYLAAYELHKNKNYQEAINYYKKVIALNPKKAEAYVNIAQIYRAQGDNTKAKNAISHGLSNLPDNKELLAVSNDIEQEAAAAVYTKASELFENKDYEGALKQYFSIKLQTPEVLFAIASCYYELNQNEKAAEYFEKLIQKNPKDTKALYFAASSYLNLENNEKAKECLNKILAIEPNNKEALDVLSAISQGEEGKKLDYAIAAYEKKDFQNANKLLDDVIAINPKNAYAHYYKGLVFEEMKSPVSAEAEYKKAIEADSNFAVCYYSLAVLLDSKEKYKEAIPYYEKYLNKSSSVEDDYTTYVKNRIKELKEYLAQQK